LKMVSIILIAVITLTTVMAVAGVVRARLAAHMEDVELLHLMGATDDYIARQFQRHIFMLSLKGCVFGSLLGIAMIKFIAWMAGSMGFALIPDFTFSGFHWGILTMI
ncbi:MAG: permease, partial [Phototrophicales bacterium]